MIVPIPVPHQTTFETSMTANRTQQPSFKSLERSPKGFQMNLSDTLAAIPWNTDGLIPVIAQDNTTQQVLMLAWANHEALLLSIQTQKAHYWSRSRSALWCKGESSGHHQAIIKIRLDCDGDALLYMVNQTGAACHTNRDHCFYWSLDSKGAQVMSNFKPKESP